MQYTYSTPNFQNIVSSIGAVVVMAQVVMLDAVAVLLMRISQC